MGYFTKVSAPALLRPCPRQWPRPRTLHRDENTGRYQRHRPEQTLLYRIVEEYYPAFAGHLAEQGRELPDYVHREFEDYLKCGRLEYGFLRVRCESCHAEHLVASRPEIMGRVLGLVGVGIGHVGSSWVADQFTKPAQSFGFPCLRIPDVLFSVRNQFTMQQVAQMSRGSTICKHLIAPNWRT